MQTTKQKQVINKESFTHYVIELDLQDNFSKTEIKNKVRKLIRNLELEIVKTVDYNFTPYGTTIAFILSSSHLIVHTWSENNYLHIDLFCCKKLISVNEIKELLKESFQTNEVLVRTVN